MYTLFAQFYYIKVGLKGVNINKHVFVMWLDCADLKLDWKYMSKRTYLYLIVDSVSITRNSPP